ncbi:MAG TPA: OmpH family outer membrane protein [Bacteroidales bacterium]|jgi:outer membrane protein|nr:OmpH family outer membrane protein [Bacteroidales bacterium]HNY44141.1 OmpH family outer membrane protein [Bacteroidales bacterium]HOD88601.1 OmpH family outer membrane protein [Bacteroidales bacterium]HOE38628.1 OmpH family outer membrane protein [Bacteroidales bacterium]HOR60665.1 OmpH family outer membrane protein [Bacteroidales bacterium]
MENSKNNKIILTISSVALLISIAALLLTVFSKNKTVAPQAVNNAVSFSNDSAISGNVAYVNLDTLLLQYKYSIKLNEDLLTEQAKAKANLESRMRAFEKKYNDFAEKMRLGSFLSQQSMESQQNELLQEQANIQQLEQDLTEKLMMKQADLNAELLDSVSNFIKEFNNGRYVLILGSVTGGGILYAEPDMDITNEVVTQLNERYEKAKKQ